jgi:hypothetical protein
MSFFIKKCHKIFGPPLCHLGQPKRASFQALEEVHRRNTSDKVKNELKILKLLVRVQIYHILTYIWKRNC